jgi:hypothetical protein
MIPAFNRPATARIVPAWHTPELLDHDLGGRSGPYRNPRLNECPEVVVPLVAPVIRQTTMLDAPASVSRSLCTMTAGWGSSQSPASTTSTTPGRLNAPSLQSRPAPHPERRSPRRRSDAGRATRRLGVSARRARSRAGPEPGARSIADLRSRQRRDDGRAAYRSPCPPCASPLARGSRNPFPRQCRPSPLSRSRLSRSHHSRSRSLSSNARRAAGRSRRP